MKGIKGLVRYMWRNVWPLSLALGVAFIAAPVMAQSGGSGSSTTLPETGVDFAGTLSALVVTLGTYVGYVLLASAAFMALRKIWRWIKREV